MGSGFDEEDLPRLLAAVDAAPDDAATRLRACVAATRRALREQDPAWADVAETLAAEALPSRQLGKALQEQLALARAARRTLCAARAKEGTADAAPLAPEAVVA